MMKKAFTQLSAVLFLLMMTMAVAAQETVNESQVTFLQAIRSTGAQAFNTSYTHKSNTRVEMDCNVVQDHQSDTVALFGTRMGRYTNAYYFYSRADGNDVPCFSRSGDETTGSGFLYGERIKLRCEGQTATWYRIANPSGRDSSNNDYAVGSVTTSGTADEGKTPMLLFNVNTSWDDGGVRPGTSPAVMTLYSCQIYESGNLVCDFTPARYGGVVGLYDRKNHTFSGSITSTPFEAVEAGTYTVTSSTTAMENGCTYNVTGDVTVSSRILASGTVTLNLGEGATLTAQKGIEVRSHCKLIINGPGSLVANADSYFPAIGGYSDHQQQYGSIIINGGNITATGGQYGAGIGGGRSNVIWANQSFITINGGVVNATGGQGAAGIGGGFRDWAGDAYGMPGVITINGGKVTANGSGVGPGIGKGGNATGNDGSLTLGWTNTSDFIYASSYSINNISFTEGKKFLLDGTETEATTSNIGGKKIVPKIEAPTIIDLSQLTGHCVVPDNTVVTGTLPGFYKVSIADGATVTFRDMTINIDPSGYVAEWDDNYRWAGITCEGDATIILERTNTVKGFCNDYPGIYVPEGKTLTIEGSGTLNAISGGNPNDDGYCLYAPGIGGGLYMSGGNVIINEGTITATGGRYSAGIGSGLGYKDASVCGNITINGGTVTANGGEQGAGIGTGRAYSNKSACGDITINGGVVTATGGTYAAGIGSGRCDTKNNDAVCGKITINGGEVTATSGIYAAAIGSGAYGSCGNITITNDIEKVVAITSYMFVGPGLYGSYGTITYGDNLASEEKKLDDRYYICTIQAAEKIKYPVWIGDTQVTYLNKGDILGNGLVSYQPDYIGGTLTFTGTPAISGSHEHALIYANDIELIINATQGLTLDSENFSVIKVDGNLTINGSVTASTASTTSPVIEASGDITFGSSILTLNGAASAICAGGTITIVETHEIAKPKGGQVKKIGDRTYIVAADGTTIAKQVVVRKKPIDLATVEGEFVAQDGDVLTGKISSERKRGIRIADGATVTLNDVTITDVESTGIICLGDATIILERTNTVKVKEERDYVFPGIYVPAGKTLIIEGDGALEASGNAECAGIGGAYLADCGNILIKGGTLLVRGGANGAAIGCSTQANCGDITITGGYITAISGHYAAAIGGSLETVCGNITITNGVTKVIATRTVSTGLATNNTEYIGKGQDSTCGIVTIGDQLTDVTVGDTRTLTGVNVLADGDANGDGSITISDALSIVSFILGTMPSDFTYYAADVNHDCKVTIADAVDVVNMILSGN